MAELVDALVSGISEATRAGSSPVIRILTSYRGSRMKVAIAYFSVSGNTQAMVDVFAGALEARGVEVSAQEAADVDQDTFLAADLQVFACPACGTEEVDDVQMQPLISDIADRLANKRVFLFGSYGWGDGAYMDTWAAEMKDLGADLLLDPITCLEYPDEEAVAALEQAAAQLVSML